jgi:hypothetical protein
MTKSWLDAAIGWDRDFSEIETFMPDDEAVDIEKSDLDKYFENLDCTHLAIKPGMEPVRMIITLPTPAQWSSIVPFMMAAGESLEEFSAIACHKLFEICVDIKSDKVVKEYREGFKRLPMQFMDWVSRNKPHWISYVGSFLLSKYQLTSEEKKQ